MRKSFTILLTWVFSLCFGITLANAQTSFTFTTLAGSPGSVVRSVDGTGSDAQFSAPRGVAVDGAGNVYVADSGNHTIRKVTASGVVTTFAGTAGTAGKTDGTGTAAQFSEPFGLAVDSAGNVFVADTNNNAIRKITPTGVVTTIAGGNGMGSSDGTGTAAKFSEPHGIAIDSAGTMYVTDYMNHTVRKVTPAGAVTTLAGSAGNSGSTDGQGTAARFMALQGITVDSAGNLYVTENGSRGVRKITPTGLVTTLANGTGTFGEPRGIAIDGSGNLFVADYTANVIRKVTSAGTISTYAGTAPTAGSTDGTTTTALFYAPSGIAVDSANNVYVADMSNNTIRKIGSTGTVTTLAGLAGRTSSLDGIGGAARFEDPYALAVDGAGNVYVADATDHSIRKIAPDGTVTTLAGKGGSFGSSDGTGAVARFKGPLGIAVDSGGSVYVADSGNSTVRKISAAGVVTTLAGSPGQNGSTDGTGTAARFSGLYGITVDSVGTLYTIESGGVVRKISAAGAVTTLAGSPGNNGFTDGTGTAARFSVPFDIAVDGSGNLYVSDHGNHAVRKVTPAGVVTTLAGSGSPGNTNATGSAASFKFPSGIATDSAGNVYLADTDNQVIRKISPAGEATTVAGSGIGSADGVGTAATFYNPKDVAVDASGNLYVADRGNHTIRKGSVQSTSLVTTTTTSTSSTSTQASTTTTVAGTTTTTASTTGTSLGAGWNLMGNGVDTPIAVASLFGDTNKVTTVWKWVPASGKWAFHAPSLVGQALSDYAAGKGYEVLTSIVGGEGFWVNAKTPFSITLPSGTAVPATSFQTSLPVGWSLIAIGETRSPSEFNALLGNTATPGTEPLNVTTLWAWDNGQSAWYFYAPSLSNSGQLASYIQGKGYLDFTGGNKKLGQGVGFWVNKPAASATTSTTSTTSTTATTTTTTQLASLGLPVVSELDTQTVGAQTFASSSKLGVSWTAPGFTVDHYEVTATESIMQTSATVSSQTTSANLTGLKASTPYSIVVKACTDSACSASSSSDPVSKTTSAEYWQLQGSGNTVSTLTKPVSDGNARLSATRFGPEAGASANTVHFYYGALHVSGQGVAVSGVVSASNPASYLSGFTSYASTSGVHSPTPTATSGIKDIGTGTGVPLSAAMGAKVRLFFESTDADGKSRIYSVDSVDGYVGRDFNLGSETTCTTSSDYLSTGGCPATVVIGVEGDAVNPTNKISAARQEKVGWPTLTDWRWNGEVGTFMVFTIDRVTGCTTAFANHAYAVWDGTTFVPQYDSAGCPKSFKSAQAALPMHIGGARYKMYFGDPSITTGITYPTRLPFLGPKKLIYADGASSGNASIVDFEDWEDVANARNVIFLWPDGTQLNDTAEGYIDDFHFLAPTGSLDIQVLYLSITDGSVTPFAAAAVLLNP